MNARQFVQIMREAKVSPEAIRTDGDVCPLCGNVLGPDLELLVCNGCHATFYPVQYAFTGDFDR